METMLDLEEGWAYAVDRRCRKELDVWEAHNRWIKNGY